MFSIIPIIIYVLISELIPALINGSGVPVFGRSSMATPILIKHWINKIVTNPLARSFPSRSGLRPATLRPSINKSRYINIINALPAKPSYSPTTAKMKSHCSSERKFPFLTDS